MDIEKLKDKTKSNWKLLASSTGILALYIVIQLYFLQTHMHVYDSFRDLTVIKEIAERGTFSYFGQGYAINPPLSYLMRGLVAKLVGFSLLTQKAFSILMFFGGQVLIYFTARNFWSKKKSFYVFLVSSLSWSFVMATRLRSFAYMLLFSSLIFYAYTRYLKNNTRKNAVLVGLTLGLGMLAKSSFAFLIAVIGLHQGIRWLNKGDTEDIVHYFLFGAVSFSLYIPYLAYLFLNGQPMPWTAQMMSITGNAAWMQNFTPKSHFVLYRRLVEMYPVMMTVSLGGIIAFREELKEKIFSPLGFAAATLLIGPLLGRIVLTKVHVYQLFFLFIPLPFLTVWTVGKALKKYQPEIEFLEEKGISTGKAAVALLVLTAGVYGAMQIDSNTTPKGEYFSDSFQEFTESLTEKDVVLSETDYVKLHALSDGYVENSNKISKSRLITYSADYYISKNPVNLSFIQKNGSLEISGKKVYKYNVQRKELLEKMNLTGQKVQIVNSNDKPVSHAQCIVAGKSWRINQISNMNGEITAIKPENYTGRTAILCKALGYDTYRGPTPPDGKINIGNKQPLIHGYKGTRY